jgi:hypothetical protein
MERRRPAWKLEAEARAINAESWEPMPGMVKKRCRQCRYFFAVPTAEAEARSRCPDWQPPYPSGYVILNRNRECHASGDGGSTDRGTDAGELRHPQHLWQSNHRIRKPPTFTGWMDDAGLPRVPSRSRTARAGRACGRWHRAMLGTRSRDNAEAAANNLRRTVHCLRSDRARVLTPRHGHARACSANDEKTSDRGCPGTFCYPSICSSDYGR